ncbi:MAG: hypothetical protein ACRC9L_02095 [Brevinema sp.]
MALNPTLLASRLNLLSTENKSQEQLSVEFANIITEYIKTANVIGTGSGSNGGGPISTIVTGSLQ